MSESESGPKLLSSYKTSENLVLRNHYLSVRMFRPERLHFLLPSHLTQINLLFINILLRKIGRYTKHISFFNVILSLDMGEVICIKKVFFNAD